MRMATYEAGTPECSNFKDASYVTIGMAVCFGPAWRDSTMDDVEMLHSLPQFFRMVRVCISGMHIGAQELTQGTDCMFSVLGSTGSHVPTP